MTAETNTPRIAIRTDDFEKLLAMVSATGAERDAAQFLAQELERAVVVAPERIAADVVTMNAVVEFRDETTGLVRRVTLVYPDRADILSGRLSVMTPVGAALIGLSVGDSIEWETRNGEWRTLTVLDVEPQAVLEPSA